MCQFSHLLSPHSFIMDAHRRTTRGGSLEAGTNFVEAHTITGICVAHEMAAAASRRCSLAYESLDRIDEKGVACLFGSRGSTPRTPPSGGPPGALPRGAPARLCEAELGGSAP